METFKILGPPGTGKTTELLSVLETELKTVAPDQLAYVSFTRMGAYEGRDRAMLKFGYAEEDLPYFRTLHSLAYRALGVTRGQIMQASHYKYFGQKMGMNFSANFGAGDTQTQDDQYLIYNALQKENKQRASKMLETLNYSAVKYVELNLKRYKESAGLYDFSDLVERFVTEKRTLPVKVAIIDEAQDLTALQWQMIRQAFCNVERLYVAGDDDQCLTTFAGADVDQFLKFKGKEKVLGHSWRLPNSVLDYAKRITGTIKNRNEKQYEGRGVEGELHRISETNSLPLDREGSWYLLARNRYHLERYTTYLRDQGYCYTVRTRQKDEKSVNESLVSTINSYERIRKGNGSNVDDQRVKPLLRFQSFEKPWYENLDLPVHEVDYLRLVIQRGKQDSGRIILSTIHAVKGGQADHVALLLDTTKAVDNNMQIDCDAEMRCYYVGATRSKHSLYVIDSSSKYSYPVFK